MQLRFTLPYDELRAAVFQLTPLRIPLTGPDEPERWVELDEPSDLELVEGVGLRGPMQGRFHFEVAKLPVKDELISVRITIRPELQHAETGAAMLAFRIELDEADLEKLPKMLDHGVVALVRRSLAPEQTKTRIPYAQLLSADLPVVARLQPLTRIELRAEGGAVRVDEDAMHFDVELDVTLVHEGEAGEQPSA